VQFRSTVSIINSTFADNQTEERGGGIEQLGGTLGVTNSIFWGNTDLNPDGNVEVAQIRER